MKQHTIVLNDKEIGFRLTSNETEELEKALKGSIYDILSTVSVTNCVKLLKYSRKDTIAKVDSMAYTLYDELVDAGYNLKTIYSDIIMPTMVISGIIEEKTEEKNV